MTAPTLPALAKAIGEWFPDLGGRSIAVSEAEVTAENVPTLPLVMVALQKETSDHAVRSNGDITITEDILIQFWSAPERYKRADGSESPFWAYYDYSAVRDALLMRMLDWKSPAGYRLRYVGMDIESDPLAVVLTFNFRHEFKWCRPPGEPPCIPVIRSRVEPASWTHPIECCCEPAVPNCPVCTTRHEKDHVE